MASPIESFRHGMIEMPLPTDKQSNNVPTQREPDIDIVIVPGLATDPLTCWAFGKTQSSNNSSKGKEDCFNWVSSSEGLKATFPESRILCYAYASSWYGKNKKESNFGNIVTELCGAVQAERQSPKEKIRPLIFIGHSMGGLVIAQALNEMDRQRYLYPDILPSVTSCLFFGTPFGGTNIAQYGKSLGEVARKFGWKCHSELLTLMEPLPGNLYLQKLSSDFKQLAAQISPCIDICCFYEAVDIGSENPWTGFSVVSNFIKNKFVDRESATSILSNSNDGVELYANHSTLVKFKGPDDDKYKKVLQNLKTRVQNSYQSAKKRRIASRQTSMMPQEMHRLTRLLESERGFKQDQALRQLDQGSWFLQEDDFKRWETRSPRKTSRLWLTGRPGIGKSSIVASAINHMRRSHDEVRSKSDFAPLLAFFLCDTTPAGSSPMELLRSLLCQLIRQNHFAAEHARRLLTTSQDRFKPQINGDVSVYDTNATLSIYNLWGCLNDILNDNAFDDVTIIISNVHLLSRGEHSDLLINQIQEHLSTTRPIDDRRTRRWLFTRIQRGGIDRFEKLVIDESEDVVDLSTERYKDKISNSLETYVMKRVNDLRHDKEYPRDQAYLIQDLMKGKAADKNWIDIQYIRLRALEGGSSTEAITQILSPDMAVDLRSLKRSCWLTILENDPSDRYALKNLLRALALAFRPPSIEELAILSGIQDQATVRTLLARCKPMVQEVSVEGETQAFEFSNSSLKVDFLWESDQGINSGDETEPLIQHFHGLFAWRCFSFMESSQNLLSSPGTLGAEAAGLANNSIPAVTTNTVYPWEFWMEHAVRGKKELAEDLARDLKSFWGIDSSLRGTWLRSLRLKMPFSSGEISSEGMTALHAAAAFGYDSLVEKLIHQGHGREFSMFNGDGYSPLHLATMYNHTQTIETLLHNSKGENINLGRNSNNGTPLHVAAIQGHVQALKILLDRGADPNANCKTLGPVINAAIRSGNNEAVLLLLKWPDHSLASEGAQAMPPLALAASLSEKEVFKDILIGGKGKWAPMDYQNALERACSINKYESVAILLEEAREALDGNMLSSSMLIAAIADSWHCVAKISEAQPGLAGSEIFYLAAVTERSDKIADQVLKDVWKASGSSISKMVVNAALYQAADNEKGSTVHWLLDLCGADPDNAVDRREAPLPAQCFDHGARQRYGNALTAAAWDGSEYIVNTLLAYGATVDNEDGCALQMAAAGGHAKIVEVLLEHGARIDRIPVEEPGYRGPEFPDGTALQAACRLGHHEVVKALLQWKGGPANANLGRGPFLVPVLAATRGDWPEVLNLLLEAEVDVNVPGDSFTLTPLINAAFYMSDNAANLLIRAGANVNQIDANGNTAIILAARKGNVRTLQLLINNKADLLHTCRNQGESALQVAARYGHAECTRILARALVPLFRALKQAATRNSTMKNLLIAPETEHEFFDEETVRPLRRELEETKLIVQETEHIREGWKLMEISVQSAKQESAKHQSERERVQREWEDFREKTERKQENYDVSIKGFRAVEGERDQKVQEIETMRLALARQQQECGHLKDAVATERRRVDELQEYRTTSEGLQQQLRTENTWLKSENTWLQSETKRLELEKNNTLVGNDVRPGYEASTTGSHGSSSNIEISEQIADSTVPRQGRLARGLDQMKNIGRRKE